MEDDRKSAVEGFKQTLPEGIVCEYDFLYDRLEVWHESLPFIREWVSGEMLHMAETKGRFHALAEEAVLQLRKRISAITN